MGITIGRQYFELRHSIDLYELEDRDIERTSTEVVDGDLLVFFLIFPVGKSRCSRLIDDTLDVESCDLSCIDRCLSLRVIEVGWNSDDGFGDFLSEKFLCIIL